MGKSDKPATILVVDDDADTRDNLSDILTDMGYAVSTAPDGPTALRMVEEDGRVFDLALLDLKMPGMSGLELYHRLKARCSSTVAIIVTAYATGDTARRAVDAGAWQVLPKPVDFAQLMPIVEEALDQPLAIVVDDDHELCDSLWDLMREHGFRTCLAHDAAAAEQRLKGRDYQVALVDMKLPRGDGSAVFRMLKHANPEARIVLITGHRDEMQDMIDQAMREGADAVCYKPFDLNLLLDTLRKITA